MLGPQLIVIGLDGAAFNVIEPMRERGDLPAFDRLMRSGAHANLRSTVPWQTPVAWTSMATGVSPGAHGVYGWWRPDLRSAELVPNSGALVNQARYWEILSGAGVRVGVVNVPMSYPARPVNGFLIAGLDSPFSAPENDPLLAYPRDVLPWLSASGAPPYQVMPPRRGGETTVEALTRWTAVERRRVEATLDLIEKYQPQFVQLNLFVTDYIAHRTRPDDPLRVSAYQVADEAIGALVHRFGAESDFLVVSDHGSCPIDHFIMIHNLLQDLGVLSFGPWLADEQVANVLGAAAGREEVDRLVAELRREGRSLRARLYNRYAAEHPGCNVGFSTIDWDRTAAFCTSDYGQVSLNRTLGAGAVTDSGGEQRLLQEITEAMLGIAVPGSGEPLVAEVLTRDQLYQGRYGPSGPDLTPILTRTDYYFCQVYSFYCAGERRVIAPIPQVVDAEATGCAGDHHADGILIASGPRIAATGSVADASVLDIAPTILNLFGVPALPEHEGVVLTHLTGDLQAAPSAASERAATAVPAEGLRERLMSLGYRI
jgi:predicted AlkP superfamily phosphohydrolase/phosphomutase